MSYVGNEPTPVATGATAGAVSCTPVGGVAATNVQAAIQELDAEKAPLGGAGTSGTWPISVTGSSVYAKQAPPDVLSAGSLTASNAGKCVVVTGNVNVPSASFAAGDIVSIFNNSAAPISILSGGGMQIIMAGGAVSGNRTLAAYGMATLWFKQPGVAVISGQGLS